MEGFPSTKFCFVYQAGDLMTVDDGPALWEEHKRMRKNGFKIDQENDVYVRKGYGAWIFNVDDSINTIEDLFNFKDEFGNKWYKDRIITLLDEGYDLVIGPGATTNNSEICGKGLYCKNYREIAERKKQEHTGREQ